MSLFLSSLLICHIYFQVLVKPQHVHYIPKVIQGCVGQLLSQVDAGDNMKQQLVADLELIQIMDRELENLSGGELQRFAIAFAAQCNADIYLFDEPSSFLDLKQRLKAAQVIRSLVRPNKLVRFSFFVKYENNFMVMTCNLCFQLCDCGRA